MKIKTSSIILFLLFKCSLSFSQDKEVLNLFYCNQTERISKLWLMDTDYALGVRMKNDPDWHVKDLVLINKNRLIIDSLSLNLIFNISESNFIDIKHFFKVSSNTFYLIHGFGTSKIKITGNKIIIDKKRLSNRKSQENILSKYPNILREALFTTDNYLIGYSRKDYKIKKQSKYSKNDHKNFPNFWIIDLKDSNKYYVINDQTPNEIETKDLFLDIKDFEIVSDRTNTFNPYVTVSQNNIFFNVTRANRCYIFNKKTKQISFFKFPELDSTKSFFFYHDYLLGRNFVVGKKKDVYQIYLLSEDFKKISFLQESEYFPIEIIDGNVHYIDDFVENGSKLKCHYLLPLFKSQQEPKLLEEIEIENGQ